MEINYRNLLARYMRRVLDAESIHYIEDYHRVSTTGMKFTSEEEAELFKIYEEIKKDYE